MTNDHQELLAGVACTMFAGFGALSGAMAQDAPAPSGTIAGFNDCVEANASLLIQQGDLIQICLNRHAAPIDRAVVNAQGSYRQTENGVIFLLRMQNTSPDAIMTGYSVILKHQKAEQPQVFTFSLYLFCRVQLWMFRLVALPMCHRMTSVKAASSSLVLTV